jgi:hypothetical protein
MLPQRQFQKLRGLRESVVKFAYSVLYTNGCYDNLSAHFPKIFSRNS